MLHAFTCCLVMTDVACAHMLACLPACLPVYRSTFEDCWAFVDFVARKFRM